MYVGLQYLLQSGEAGMCYLSGGCHNHIDLGDLVLTVQFSQESLGCRGGDSWKYCSWGLGFAARNINIIIMCFYPQEYDCVSVTCIVFLFNPMFYVALTAYLSRSDSLIKYFLI